MGSRSCGCSKMVLGYSRYVFARFVRRQDLASVVRCHLEAFAELGGTPREVLYDRMKTAGLGEDDAGQVRYHPTLLDGATHFGLRPRACAAYRAKTKGKVERVFRYVREDCFLGTEFADLHTLNTELDHWRATVAHRRVHGTTGRRVDEAFAEERAVLQALPTHPYATVLRLERRLSRDGRVSVDGNAYSVPDSLTPRSVAVHRLAEQVHIYDAGELVAVHPVLQGRGERRVDEAHRHWPPPGAHPPKRCELPALAPPGQRVAQRSLGVYETLGKALAKAPLEGAPR